MNKTQLVDALAERLGGDRRTAASAVEGLLETIVDTVRSGDSVTITGFGVFEGRARAARTARNPRTGEAVDVPATTVPAFRPGASFRSAVGGSATPAPRAAATRSRPAQTAKAAASFAEQQAATEAETGAAVPRKQPRTRKAATPVKAAPAKAAPAKAAPAKAAPAKAGPTKAASTKAAPTKSTPAKAGKVEKAAKAKPAAPVKGPVKDAEKVKKAEKAKKAKK
ncbi:HU family DNA-binding protein [Pseudonocardia sp. MH-G8]|uniref:HU family DNA-binding protein n=1 Tax=Pseudonocardia sp. MH-G8 TaxID=1854588 RepID=UPI000BA0F890|nr:HU family DNA-binding protein [Pseudonocardia sp. MH-G8]OZM81768.1 DNA-binding protein [Pseudonocardia sp. MH-G8]